MSAVLLYKQLFIYLIPFNFLIGEYGVGMQYRYTDDWAVDVTLGYVADIENSFTSSVYQDILKTGTFYYSGPFIKASLLSVVPRGSNPLRTDYNQVEVGYRLLGYKNLDFEDESDPGKLFNLTERMQAVSLSWKAGYNIIPRSNFEMNGFLGFGMQLRFKNTLVNSYGYYYNSDLFVVNDQIRSTQVVPLFHAGIKIGLKTLEKK